jgi:hypothetical protein
VLGNCGEHTTHKRYHLEWQKALDTHFLLFHREVGVLLREKFHVLRPMHNAEVSLGELLSYSLIIETSDQPIQDYALDTSDRLVQSELLQLG